jgi:dTDP-glucose 4,6-dehydratase
MEMRRILVTGGCGFIGSALVRHLVGQTATAVLNIDKLTYAGTLDAVESIADNVRYKFEKVDVADLAAVSAILAVFEPDVVFHLAAESHVDRSIDGPGDFVHTNLLGTYSLLEGAYAYWNTLDADRKQSFRFVHVSTDEVYGTLGYADPPFSEQSPYRPNSPYAATKAGADHLARAWHRTYQLPVIISNCCNNFGPYQFPEKLLPTIILAAMEGRPLPVYGDGSNVREWLHVEDHVRALLAIAERGQPGGTYVVGTNNESSNLELARKICRIMDRLFPNSAQVPHERLIQFVPDRPGHDLRYAVNSERIRTELGWRAQESFDTGLEKTVRWYAQNERWWGKLRKERYGGQRLGLSGKRAVTALERS